MQVTFAYDLVFRTMNKFFHTWRKQLHVITSGEIGEQSFGFTGLIFFAHEYLFQILKK